MVNKSQLKKKKNPNQNKLLSSELDSPSSILDVLNLSPTAEELHFHNPNFSL